MQLLLGAEPHLTNGFKVLSKRAKSDESRTLCNEGITYTLRRVDRIKKALKNLDSFPFVERAVSNFSSISATSLWSALSKAIASFAAM